MLGFIRRHLPLGSGALGLYPTGHRQESRPIWIGWRQGDPDAEFELPDAPGDLEGGVADGFERRLAPQRAAGRGLEKLVQ